MFPTAPSVAREARATVGDAATSTESTSLPTSRSVRDVFIRDKSIVLSVFPAEYGEGLSFNAS